MGAITWSPLAGGWLSGNYRMGVELPKSLRATRIPQRYDMSIPGNQRKLEVAEELAKLAEGSGMSLVHLAVGFVISHPGVTSAIIGPRTMEQLDDLIAGVDVALSDEILDEIDAIVPPGTDVGRLDMAYNPPAIQNEWLRRRPINDRSAA
jgi:aryl-alcohol dehydrogenase-like predicted oxidoreductase